MAGALLRVSVLLFLSLPLAAAELQQAVDRIAAKAGWTDTTRHDAAYTLFLRDLHAR